MKWKATEYLLRIINIQYLIPPRKSLLSNNSAEIITASCNFSGHSSIILKNGEKKQTRDYEKSNAIFLTEIEKKICSTCGITKSTSQFWRNSRARNGWASNCKNCRRISRLLYIDRQKKSEESRRYYNRNRKHVIERMRSYYKKNRDGIKARNILKRNLFIGKIIKQPCEVCGAISVDAHHEDYSRPLDVRWLCRRHHREYHIQEVSNA